MNLQISAKDMGAPTLEQITRAVHDEEYRDEFFILSKNDSCFLQVLGPNDRLHVEYRNGSSDEHYYCASSITCDELVKLCLKYIADEDKWNHGFEWKYLDELKDKHQMTWSISGL